MSDAQVYYSKKMKSPYGDIHILTIGEIFDIGEGLYNEILLAFCVNLKLFKIKEKVKSQMQNFDIYWVSDEIISKENEMTYMQLLTKGLSLFFKTENIKICPELNSISMNDEIVINRDNFDDLADYVLKAYSKERIEPEQEPEFKCEEDRDVWLKVQKAKKRRESKETITLKDMLDVVVHSKNLNYNYESVLNITYTQLVNSYKVVMSIENFEFIKSFLGMGVDTKEMDLTHWSEKIRQK